MTRYLVLAAALAFAGIAGARAGGPYDGTYHGQLTGGDMNATSCAKSASVQMTVTDNRLEYHHFSNATITATVAADGSFSGSAQNRYTGRGQGTPNVQTLDGKITAGAITAETKVGNNCSYKLTLRRYS
jgi:hypothetical protein